MLGSLATFAIVLTVGPVVGFVLAIILGILGMAGAAEGEGSSLVGVSLTLVLAFFLGGYVAGRSASRSKARRGGLLAALLALVAVMFLTVAGALLGSGLGNGLSGVRFPSTPEDVRNLGAIMPVFGVLALILPFIGGAVGGVRGAKMGRKRRT